MSISPLQAHCNRTTSVRLNFRMARHPSLWRNVLRIKLLIPTISGIRDGKPRVADCGISAIKEVKQSCENDENNQTGLRAARTTREPVGPVKADIEEMARNGLAIIAGVGLSKDDHVGIVRSRVKPHCEPQTPRTAKRQAPKDAVKSNADRVDPVFMRFKEEMRSPKIDESTIAAGQKPMPSASVFSA